MAAYTHSWLENIHCDSRTVCTALSSLRACTVERLLAFEVEDTRYDVLTSPVCHADIDVVLRSSLHSSDSLADCSAAQLARPLTTIIGPDYSRGTSGRQLPVLLQ